jgi:ribosomal-protein-alanine N-acetyltransferase
LIIETSPFPELQTARLLLRKLTMDDRYELMWLRSDDRVNQYLERGKSMNIDEASEFVTKIDKNLEDRRSYYWVICLTEGHTLIGTICLWNFEPEKELAELGYELSPMYQGKGIMHEAVAAIIKYGFDIIGLKVITAITHPQNEPSMKLLERSCFRHDINYDHVLKSEAEDQEVYFLLAP